MPPVADSVKTTFIQIVFSVLAAAGGGWMGVQITLATMSVQLLNLSDRLGKVEVSHENATVYYNELRERVVRCEVQQELSKKHP